MTKKVKAAPAVDDEIYLDMPGSQQPVVLAEIVERSGAEGAEAGVDARDIINRRIGRASVIRMAIKLFTVTDLIDLQRIKDSKQYKGFEHIGEDGIPQRITTWREYCRLVEGRSVESVDLDLKNFDLLGPELFEAMRVVGIGPGTMRQFRKLPPDQRTALIDMAKSGDKDDLLELAEELLEKERADKEELAADKAALEKRAHVLERELEKTSSEYRRFKEGLKRQVGKAVFADRTGMVREEAMAYQLEGQLAVDSLAKLFDEVIREPMQDDPEWRARFEIVWIQAKALYARARLLMEAMVQAGATDDIPLGAHMLTADEAAVWLADAELIYREHEAQKQRRELAREASKPRGPGRPKGSGKKGAE